jgi:hypothetical protein
VPYEPRRGDETFTITPNFSVVGARGVGKQTVVLAMETEGWPEELGRIHGDGTPVARNY